VIPLIEEFRDMTPEDDQEERDTDELENVPPHVSILTLAIFEP
jgi:hypothetical protein